MADYYELPVNKGMLVVNIAPDSPVDKAEIRQGDIVLESDNKKVDRVEDLQSVLLKRKPGDRAELTILRGLKTGRLELILERVP